MKRRRLKTGDGLDDEGFIVSDVNLKLIDDVYMPFIRESVEKLKNSFSRNLHSVYVYGSVARGDAIQCKSDLDLLTVYQEQLSSDQSSHLKLLAEQLSYKANLLFREVGIAVGYYDYIMDPANYYEQAFLKELCVCLYGEDLRPRFGPYKLTPEIAISFNGDICDVLQRTMRRISIASDEEFKSIIQGFARKLIRTYYSMVMARSQIWSTRLNEQSEVFIHHFPMKEANVRTILNWAGGASIDRNICIKLFREEGQWLCENFFNEANKTNDKD